MPACSSVPMLWPCNVGCHSADTEHDTPFRNRLHGLVRPWPSPTFHTWIERSSMLPWWHSVRTYRMQTWISHICFSIGHLMGLSHQRIFRRITRRTYGHTSRSLYTSFAFAPNTLTYVLTRSHTAKPQEEFLWYSVPLSHKWRPSSHWSV